MILVLLAGGGFVGWQAYQAIYQPNVVLEDNDSPYVYIATGDDFQKVSAQLYERKMILNRSSFEWVAEQKKYTGHVRPGRYKVEAGMTNSELVNLLRSGKQEPVKLVFHNVRTLPDLAGRIARQIEADSTKLVSAMLSTESAREYGFNEHSFRSMFIPNTYQLNWNTSAKQFLDRMAREFKVFWNEKRKMKARELNLQQSEVHTLASIVEEETSKREEAPRIAGVYVNRLRKGMPLQADPTLKWAIGDFTIKRLLDKDKEINSPYNTYKYRGLPPGPIRLADTRYIDAVLDYERHDYLYFCAREDFSGYTNFAKTYAQHLVNARRYQRALNQRKIYR
ncbi:MAG: endolytic transglycosylase MltG [Salibacteraceae bacterium]